jgi:hypothetical protein
MQRLWAAQEQCQTWTLRVVQHQGKIPAKTHKWPVISFQKQKDTKSTGIYWDNLDRRSTPNLGFKSYLLNSV